MRISTKHVLLSLTALGLTACSPNLNTAEISTDITETLQAQAAAWNAGDIDAFMDDYLKSPNLRFASGGTITTGWQPTIERYKARYPDKATMGTLAFTDLDIKVLSRTDALVFGRWELTRDADTPNGLFTLHFRHINGAWVIISDHTSSAA